MNAVEVPEGVMNPILEPRTPGDGAGTSTVFTAKGVWEDGEEMPS